MTQVEFDESLVEQLEALYATRDVRRRRGLVHEALGAHPGDRVVDAGCGPGFYVTELLDTVGLQGAVTGVDRSAEMLAVARRRCGDRPNLTFVEADVTALPLADASADCALAVQVLEYVANLDAALSELHRVLRPGGRAVLWDVDWSTVSWHSTDPERMNRVLVAWDDHLAHPALPRTLTARLRAVGFVDVAAAGHAFATADFISDAYGVSVMDVVGRYVSGHAAIGPELASAWSDEQRELGDRGAFFFACTQVCFVATRPDT